MPPQPGEWAFGAGLQAITFVSRIDDATYLEHGESWYRASNAMAKTPGHEGTGGRQYRTFDPSAGIVKCFACHSTGPLRLDDDASIHPGELGVRCEICHGPAAEHAANPGKIKPRNPGRMTGSQMNTMCGTCHRAVSSAEDTANLRDPWNARHQPLLLAASKCFQKSDGRVTCITCHSPHQALVATPATYNAACSKCHASPRHVVSIAQQACTECHMPKVRIDSNLAFSNHRIATYAAADPMSPISSVIATKK